MKKQLLASVLAIGMALGATAQDKVTDANLPTGIQSSFKTQFANASGTEWKMKDGTYKAQFKVNGIRNVAAFDDQGKLVSRGVEIKESELPASINTAIGSTYADRKISEIYKMDKNGVPGYMVKFNGSPEKKAFYDANGQEINDKSNW